MKIKEVKGNFGSCVFDDCVEFMKTQKENQYDLGFSDPPWGHDYDGKHPMGINAQTYKPEIENYNDTFDPEWNLQWFTELRRICKRVVIAMGWKHFNWWVKNTDPRGYFFLIFKNGQGSTKVCKHNATHPSPKPFKDWLKMIKELNPESLFDPFAGTCPIGEVGES